MDSYYRTVSRWSVLLLTVFVGLCDCLAETFNPKLEVLSCTRHKLVMSATDAAEDGIIFVLGQGTACKQKTRAEEQTYTFDFIACNILWDEQFKIVVQKRSKYQTGEDKVIPVTCISDTGDLFVEAGVGVSDKADDTSVNKTVRPSAIMKIYRAGVDVTGGVVKLSDRLELKIDLDIEFKADFDIRAKLCTAATFTIIDKDCAPEVELFPNFIHPSQGSLVADFGAFRPTDMSGGSIPMVFSCTISLCRGLCTPTICENEELGWGRRKKRSAVNKTLALHRYRAGQKHERPSQVLSRYRREGEEGPPALADDEVTVGTFLRVSSENIIVAEPPRDEVCLDTLAFIAGLVAMTAGLIASSVACVVMAKKLMMRNAMLKTMGTSNSN